MTQCWSILFLSSCLFLSLFTTFSRVWTIGGIGGKGRRDCSSHKTIYFFFFFYIYLIQNENISSNSRNKILNFHFPEGNSLFWLISKYMQIVNILREGEREEVSLLYRRAFWLKILYHQAPLDQSEWKILRSLYLTL